jgi:predicted small lipoprotein YifL
MIRNKVTITSAIAITALLAALSGCEKQEGPLEKAGKEVDNAAATVGQKIENAGEKMQDAAQGDKK